MSKALVFGLCAMALSAGTASAQGYGGYDNGYAAPVADLAAPADRYGYGGYGYGYAAPPNTYAVPVPAPVHTAPPVYAAPVYTAPAYAAPAPVYTAPPVASGYYTAGVVSQPIYNYAPGYWGGRGYWRRW